MKNFSFDELYIFMVVGELDSFQVAGKFFGVNSTTIGRKLSSLENDLGVVLLNRFNNSFEITEIGKELLQQVKNSQLNILELKKLVTDIVETNREPSGDLSVILPVGLAQDKISLHVPKFLRQYPKINLNLCFQNKEPSLVKNNIDLAVTQVKPLQPNQKFKIIYSSPFRFFCTKSYAQKYGVPKTPEELSNHLVTGLLWDDYIVPEFITITHKKSNQEVIVPMPKKITSNNSFNNAQLLLSGEVIGGILDFNPVNRDELIEVLPEFFLGEIKFYMSRHPYRNDKKIKLFADFLESVLNAED